MTPHLHTPRLVALVAAALAVAATAFVAVAGRQRDEARFDSARRDARDRVTGRIETYVAFLEGGRAFFSGSDSVTTADFQRWARAIDVRRRYPGIQGVGFTRRLTPAETSAVFAHRRADGVPGFRLTPLEPRRELHAILFLEPLDERNRAALGFDMFTEPVRREAMIRARDTGMPAMSGRVRLLQEIVGPVQPGFLIYAPVYRGGGIPPTEAERRARLLGFVYAPFRTGDLFANLFGSEERPRVALRVYDGAIADPNALLADTHVREGESHGGRGYRREQIEIAGHPWLLEYHALAASDPLATPLLTAATALIGLLVTLTLWRIATGEAAARARAQQSDAMRGRFFAAMSHELRTPVNAILGYNDLVLAEVYGPLTEAQREAIARGQRAARHLHELVNDVLDISKLEAGKIEIVAEPVELSALIDDMMTTIVPMASERGCDLVRQDASCPITLDTDPRRVRQILLNLLSNATKFGAGRPVHLRCALLAAPGEAVAIEVCDEGPGIAPQDVARIWEEFVQLGATEGGTGLGLPISRRLAELLGGRLEVDTTPGRGSTFRLVLPPEAPDRLPRATTRRGPRPSIDQIEAIRPERKS